MRKTLFKRLLPLLLLASLLCPAALPARAENRNLLLLEQSDYVSTYNTSCAVGDALYAYDARELKSYTLGGDGLSVVGRLDALPPPDGGDAAYVTQLFAFDGALHGLCESTGDVWRLIDEAGALNPTHALRLDLSVLMDAEGYPEASVLKVAATKDCLCACVSEGMSDVGSMLISWSLQTGDRLETSADGLATFVAPYDGERVLALMEEEQYEWEESAEKAPYKLCAFAPASGEATLLATVTLPSVSAALYRPEAGAFCLLTDSVAYRLAAAPEGETADGGENNEALAPSAYLPWQIYGGEDIGLLGDDHLYIVDDMQGITVRELDGENVRQGALIVMNGPETAQHNAFLREHPEASVTLTDDALYSYEELVTGIQTGSLDFDLIGLHLTDIPFERLARKGYLMEITDPALLQAADRMEPALIDACRVDGKLYALPLHCYGDMFSYERYTLELMEMMPDDLPHTFLELCDFVEHWPESYGEEHPDMTPFWDSNLDSTLYQSMLDQYEAAMLRSGQKLSYDTELFRTLLSRLGAIDFDALKEAFGVEEDGFWDKRSLLNSMNPMNIMEPNDIYARLPLPLAQGMETVCPVRMQAMMVSARSERKELANAYLRAIVENYDPSYGGVIFYPDQNDEVERPDWDEGLEETKQQIALLEKQLESNPDNAAELRQQLGGLQEDVSNIEFNRVEVSREAIALYREQVAPTLCVQRYVPERVAIGAVIARFADGAIGVEQAISEMENRLRLAQLEDE